MQDGASGGPKKGNPLAVMLKYWRYSVGGSLMGVIDPRFRKLKKPQVFLEDTLSIRPLLAKVPKIGGTKIKTASTKYRLGVEHIMRYMTMGYAPRLNFAVFLSAGIRPKLYTMTMKRKKGNE